VLERRYGAAHPALAPAFAGLASVAVAKGDDPSVAIALAERAVATAGTGPEPTEPGSEPEGSAELARARATLATALHARDPDDPRALELARTARRRLLDAGASAWIITRTSEIIAARVEPEPRAAPPPR